MKKSPKDQDADSLAAFANWRGHEQHTRSVARANGLTWKAVKKRMKKLRRPKARGEYSPLPPDVSRDAAIEFSRKHGLVE